MSENNSKGPHGDTPSSSGDGSGGRRLPPPAFPPGARRVNVRRSLDVAREAPDSGVPDDAFISPDAPFERSDDKGIAFISPDDPILHRDPHRTLVADEPGGEGDDDAFDADDVVVTGIGDNAHLDPEELAMGGDPHVRDLVEQVGKLTEALRHRGEAGLRTTAEMSRFEATLRSYCVGYLAGRRAEDEQR